MTSVVDKVQSVLNKDEDSNHQFYRDYVKFALMYQNLIEKGVVSKRQSQLLSISDKVTMAPIHFNHSDLQAKN